MTQTKVNDDDTRWTFHACPICDEPIDLGETSPEVADRDDVARDFTACAVCATLFPTGANAAESAEDVTAAETTRQAEYHAQLWDDVNFEQLDLLGATAMRLASEFAEFLEEPHASGAIIDIGAGRGNILQAVRRLGFRVGGCEPSPQLAEVAKAAYLLGPDILENRDADRYLAGLADRPQRISGFIIWHVLEHLRHPMPLLEKCLTIAPDARFFIELPLAIKPDIFSEHLFFPTPRTLVWIAEELGLDVELLQITADDRLRVFYRGRPADPELVKVPDNTTMDHLEATYAAMSPSFAHFAPLFASADAPPTVGTTKVATDA